MMITARLEQAVLDSTYSVVWGFVYDDAKNRFSDGMWIHTSDIPDIENVRKNKPDIIHTLNSTYSVKWADM